MAELNKRNIHNVANAFHFSTVEKILGLVMASDLRNTFRPLGALAEELMRRFQREDTAYKLSLKNFTSDDIGVLDSKRDKYAQFLKSVLTAYTYLPEEGMVRQASVLLQVFKDYKWRPSEAYLAETAKLDNMLQEWDKEQPTAWLQAMGLTPLVAALRGLNTQLRELMSDRSTEQAEYLVGELRAARLEVDEAYAKLIAYLNALLLISPSEELTQLEKVLNQDIKLLEAQLAAGKKHSSSGSSGNNGSSGSNGSGGGTTVISNEDTIQGLE